MGLQGLGNAMEVELVGITLAMDLGHDVLVIVVAEGTAELVVVHVRLALPFPPAPGHLVWVRHLELPIGPLPGDAVGVGAVRQELQEELPQLDLPTAWVCKSATGGSKDLVRIELRTLVFSFGDC